MLGRATLTMKRSRLASTTPAETIASTTFPETSSGRGRRRSWLRVPIARRYQSWLRKVKVSYTGTMSETLRLTGPLDPRSGWEADDCSIAQALDVVSTRSAFLVLREAFYGATRFDEFAARAQISEPVAAARLRELVDRGLLEHEPYRDAGQRTRQGYRLTPMGADLLPALVALMQWGDRWLKDDGGALELRHHDCGAQVHAELRCEAGHAVGGGDVAVAVPRRRRRRPASGR